MGQNQKKEAAVLEHAKNEKELAEIIKARLLEEAKNEHNEDALGIAQEDLAKNFSDIFDGKNYIQTKTVKLENGGRRSFIYAVLTDRPFLIDSFISCIHLKGYRLRCISHPDFMAVKAGKGVKFVDSNEFDGVSGGILYAELTQALLEKSRKALTDDLHQVMEDVRLATTDWQVMLEKTRGVRDRLRHIPAAQARYKTQGYQDFMQFLHDDSFTFLGYCRYDFKPDGDNLKATLKTKEGLGLLSHERSSAFIDVAKDVFPTDLKKYVAQTDVITISKIQKTSPVHRAVPIDCIIVKRFDQNGQVEGEDVFIGLFTSITYSRSVFDIPLINEKIEKVIAGSGYKERTHGYRAMVHILEKYPRDEVFQMRSGRLKEYALSILELQECQRIALYPRKDIFGRYVSALVYIPKSVFDTRLRKIFQNILEEELGGENASFYVMMDDSALVRVLFVVLTEDIHEQTHDFSKIEQRMIEEGQDWSARLVSCIADEVDDTEEASVLAERYIDAFPESYKAQYTDHVAVQDIAFVEKAIETGCLQIDLHREKEKGFGVKLYHANSSVVLSDVLPILENFGLRIISEAPHQITPEGDENVVWMHDLTVELCDRSIDDIDYMCVKPLFEEALLQIWNENAENDGLNALIVNSCMTWRQVSVVRSYMHYMRQIRFPHGQGLIIQALNKHADIAGLLSEKFDILFNPRREGRNKTPLQKINKSITEALEGVASYEYDRILKAINTYMDHTLRTNFFQEQEPGGFKSYISFKIKSKDLADVPAPKPWAEIFVYSPKVCGVHLRGGRIARGGIRWSDRQDDFRTEILGLMKAQMVKNAVIVPVGSKGGFIVRNMPANPSREERQNLGIEAYKTFIRGLMDITDNLDDKGGVIPPKDVVRLDDDDPYLVVAADKGTATFSDIANGISAEYNFWLSDAFASGGSAGYDHKEMGITAKGGWEAVKRHFRELGKDIQNEDFTAIGIGDMAGDVFGNGMLLSEHIRLVAAFNHKHIFVDPDPNAETSYKERQRLFDEVLGWDEYNKSFLSKGGMIYSRDEKELTLTPEIKKLFGFETKTVSPYELMHAILKHEAELLWFGGIGTYIKAESESHADVSDKANDMIRINGKECGAKVIGEGANLGMTQKARIEYGLHGGKANTDFIDNSGGVNCSDQEVNIKILLSQVFSEKNRDDRNDLLEDMAGSVSEAVLYNNYQQTQAISLMEASANEDFAYYIRLIEMLEIKTGLNRKIEELPDYEQAQERMSKGQPLTRAELAVLLSYSKIMFFNEILDSDIPEQSMADLWLQCYFPEQLQKKYKAQIKAHRLNREIIATEVANAVINRVGPVFIYRCAEQTGASASEVVRAYLLTRDIFDLAPLWAAIESADNKVAADVQIHGFKDIAALVEHATLWFLKHTDVLKDIDQALNDFRDAYKVLENEIVNALPKVLRKNYEDRQAYYFNAGFNEKVSQRLAMLQNLVVGLDIAYLSQKTKIDIKDATALYYSVGERFSLVWLRNEARALNTENAWEEEATQGYIDRYFVIQSEMAAKIVMQKGKADVGDALDAWGETQTQMLVQYDAFMRDYRQSGDTTLAKLAAAEQRLRGFLS